MLETGDDAVIRGRDNDDEVLAALSSMTQGGSRDFLAEQEVREFNAVEAKAAQAKAAKARRTVAKKPAVIVPAVKPKAQGGRLLRRAGVPLTMEEEIEEVRRRHQMETGPQRKAADKLADVLTKEPWEYDDRDEEMEDLMESMRPKDPRDVLLARAVEKGFQRCAVFSCEKF